jgi:hypothetical protein
MTRSRLRRRRLLAVALLVLTLVSAMTLPASGATRPRRVAAPKVFRSTAKPTATTAATTAATTTAPTRLTLAGARLVNYYPASHGWTTMWSAWDGAEFDADMAKIAQLGGNAVRLIVQPQAFGYPAPSAAMQARLAQAVEIAGRHGLGVELTLFDWFSGYTDIAGSKAWASALLAPYRNDVRVFAVELQNELPVENSAAVTWAAALLPHLAGLTDAPTTVSVNGSPARLATLATGLGSVRPSFWSYHYYDQVLGAGANSAFSSVKAAAGGLPVFIGETGVDTLPRLGEDETTALDRQDHFYRAVFTAAREQGLPVPAPWTLFDFTTGAIPGQPKATEFRFGVLRSDGTQKPAAGTVRNAFTGQPLSTSFNGSFERSSSMLPAEWSTYLPDQMTAAVDRAVAHSGAASVRLSGSLGDATGWPSLRTPVVQALRPGTVYTATAWAKGTSVTGTNRLAITWYDAQGRYIGATASLVVPVGTTAWQPLTASGPAPTNAAAAFVQLQTTRNAGAVWFDDVTFD